MYRIMRENICSLKLYDLFPEDCKIYTLQSWCLAPFLLQFAEKLGCNSTASISRIIEKKSIFYIYNLYILRLKLLIELKNIIL